METHAPAPPHAAADHDAPTDFTRTAPHDVEAERAALCGMLHSPDAVNAVRAILDDGRDLYRPAHLTIYTAICDLADRGDRPDPITVTAELTRRGEIGRAGGPGYVHHIAQVMPTAANVEHYAEIVHERALLRRVIEIGTRIAARGYAGDTDPDEILADARAELGTTTARDHHGGRLVDGAAFILDLPEHVPAVWGEDDRVLWAEGEALIIAGPPGVGKTTLAQQVVLAAIGLRPAVLGLAVRPAKRVLYLASDRPAQAARSLARMVTEHDRAVLAQQLVIWKGPPPSDFIKDPGTLLRLCKQADADMVCLDSLKDMAGELASEEGGQAINQAIQRTLVEGIEVIALHHHRKQGGGKDAGKEPHTPDELYGSVWITAGAGSIVSLWGAAGDPIVQMRHLKQPAAEVGPWRLKHDHTAGRTELWHQVDVLDVLVHARAPLTAAQLAMQIYSPEKGKPTPSETEKARRRLEALVEKRLAHRVPNAGEGGKATGYVAAVTPDGEIHE